MQLLIDDTFATGTYTMPLVAGWVAIPDGVTAEIVAEITSAHVGPEYAALVPSAEVPALQQTHLVVPDFAVIANATGAIAMRTPVRPDEIEATPIRLLDASGTAELLARATLRPFYGIAPTAWIRDGNEPEAARAEVVVVEGADALREPEGGFSEDLCRAWFILTAQPVVTHVLLAPRDLPDGVRLNLLAFLDAVRAEGLARRREWRPAYAERQGIASDRAGAFWAAQRLSLEAEDRLALQSLLQNGSSGTFGSSPLNVQFSDGADFI